MGEPQFEATAYDLVSQRVNHLRFLKKWSQKFVAAHIGLTPSAFSNKMGGATRWTLEEVIGLADLFDVDLDALVGRSRPSESASADKKAPGDDAQGANGEQSVGVKERDLTIMSRAL